MRGLLWLLVLCGICTLRGSTAAAGQSATSPEGFPLPPGVSWVANPMLPPGGQVAVLVGTLQGTGPYAARIAFSSGLKVMPHWHPEARVYTVLSGTWLIGIGERFDETELEAFPTGAVYLLPAGTRHFHWARDGASVVQISGIGPSGTNYVNPNDDPRPPPGR